MLCTRAELDGNPCGGNVTVHLDGSPALATKEHADYVIMVRARRFIQAEPLVRKMRAYKYIRNVQSPMHFR